jgi:hypothetical protein
MVMQSVLTWFVLSVGVMHSVLTWVVLCVGVDLKYNLRLVSFA